MQFSAPVFDAYSDLTSAIAALPRPVVFTNGCFDILHRGHVTYLQEARALGASMVLALNTDASVQRLDKSPERPINPLADRAAVMAALACVDLVVAFDEDTPLQVIKQIRPDHLVKGGDWAPADIVGSDEVTQWGGQVHSLAFKFSRSTTALIERIKQG